MNSTPQNKEKWSNGIHHTNLGIQSTMYGDVFMCRRSYLIYDLKNLSAGFGPFCQSILVSIKNGYLVVVLKK